MKLRNRYASSPFLVVTRKKPAEALCRLRSLSRRGFVILASLGIGLLCLTIVIAGPTAAADTESAAVAIPIAIAGFDASRGGQLSLPEGGFFVDARTTIASAFADISYQSLNTLSAAGLAAADMVILSSGTAGQAAIAPLTPTEQAALLSFVEGGGCAVLLTDNDSFASNAAAANESLLDPFGMDSAGTIERAVAAPIANPGLSTLTAGPYGTIQQIYQGWPGGLTSLGVHGVALAHNPLGDALAVIEPTLLSPTSGPVIVFSDISAFADDSDGGHFSSNDALFLNVISHCLNLRQLFLPSIISYQGMLRDGGAAADGLYDVQFQLYDSEQNGAMVGQAIVRQDLMVNSGVFAADLDFGDLYTGQPLWLELAIRPGAATGSFTILTPRQPLRATPFALYANHVSWYGVRDVPAGFADGRDNDTTYGAGLGLQLNGANFDLLTSFALPQSCSSGEVAKWEGSSWQCSPDLTGNGTPGWYLTGNSGTAPETHFLGTTDNQPLALHVNGQRALWLVPHPVSPNLIGGYNGNSASGAIGATIGGGGSSSAINVVSADFGTVSGGSGNVSSEIYTTVGGGVGNQANGIYGVIAGGQDNVINGSHGSIGGGITNTIYAGTVDATIGGGRANVISASVGTIAGGGSWLIDLQGGGYWTGGNTVGDFAGTIGGGWGNHIHGPTLDPLNGHLGAPTIAGGGGNRVRGSYATVGGGGNNDAWGFAATSPGGFLNSADGDYSFAAGCGAETFYDGVFIWKDSTGCNPHGAQLFTAQRDNQFAVLANGGVFLQNRHAGEWVEFLYPESSGGLIGTSSGAFLSMGGTWTNASDVALKENFSPVDNEVILAMLAELPIRQWNYIAEADQIIHIGPTAQDFHSAFGLGDSDTAIATVDADGIAFAAIQALNELNQAQAVQISALQEQNDDLEVRLTRLEASAGRNRGGLWSWLPLLAAGMVLLLGRHRPGKVTS